MVWNVIISLAVAHDYYAPNPAPVLVQPTDAAEFAREGFLLRQSGRQWIVVAEEDATALPAAVMLDVVAQNTETLSVTNGANWSHVPQLTLPLGTNEATLMPAQTAEAVQYPARKVLARLHIVRDPENPRHVTAQFSAMASHWAYHVIGPNSDEVTIEDTEGEVLFDPLGAVTLPEGVTANVIRSRQALPARARPGQRFTLSRPGRFGPRTLIPVLPAPEPLFVTVPDPDGAGAIIQSDIYVSIF